MSPNPALVFTRLLYRSTVHFRGDSYSARGNPRFQAHLNTYPHHRLLQPATTTNQQCHQIPRTMIRLLPCKFQSYVSSSYLSSSVQIRQFTLSIPLLLSPRRDPREHHGQVHNFIHLCPDRWPHSSSLRLLSRLHRRHNRAPFLPQALLSLQPLPRSTSINTGANHHILACRRIIRRPARDALLLEIWEEGVFGSRGRAVCAWCWHAVT